MASDADEPLVPEPMTVPFDDTGERLLADILADPAADLPRLVYADWLDEHGKHDRAEFIRVQCELARLPELERDGFTVTEWHGTGPSDWVPMADALRRRERELWPHVGPSFRPGDDWDAHYDPAAGGPNRFALVSRGFVSHVTATAVTLFGGPCRWCDGTTVVYCALPDKRGRTRGGRWITGCRVCGGSEEQDGTGRTPGIAAALFGSQPVEGVTLTNAVVHPSGGNDTYYLGGLGQFPSKYWGRLEGLPSRRAVLDATSAVCVDYGRSLAAGRHHDARCDRCKGDTHHRFVDDTGTTYRNKVAGTCGVCHGKGTVRRPGLAPLGRH